jgi:hypothetical protein
MILKTGDERFPTGWKLEISLNARKWKIADIHQQDQQLSRSNKVASFKVNKPVQTSWIRLTLLSSTNENGWIHLKGFEIFGDIQEDQRLQSLISIPKVFSIPDLIEFKFNRHDHFGLFNFFKDCSIQMRNEIFVLSCSNSADGFLSQILIEWNNDIWISKDDSDAWINVAFKDPWIFQISGYRLRAENQKFLQTWEIRGSKPGDLDADIVLDEQRENRILSSIYSEISFEIGNR